MSKKRMNHVEKLYRSLAQIERQAIADGRNECDDVAELIWKSGMDAIHQQIMIDLYYGKINDAQADALEYHFGLI